MTEITLEAVREGINQARFKAEVGEPTDHILDQTITLFVPKIVGGSVSAGGGTAYLDQTTAVESLANLDAPAGWDHVTITEKRTFNVPQIVLDYLAQEGQIDLGLLHLCEISYKK